VVFVRREKGKTYFETDVIVWESRPSLDEKGWISFFCPNNDAARKLKHVLENAHLDEVHLDDKLVVQMGYD
jgi:hypothetical protein